MAFITNGDQTVYRSGFGDLPLKEKPTEGHADVGLYASYLNAKLASFYTDSDKPISEMPHLTFSEWRLSNKWLRKNGIGDVA